MLKRHFIGSALLATLVVLASQFSVARADGGITITSLSPSSGPVGTSVTVSISAPGLTYGSSFNLTFGPNVISNISPVSVAYPSCAYGATSCNPIGQLVFTVPGQISCTVGTCAMIAPGTYNVTVANGNGVSNTVPFILTGITTTTPTPIPTPVTTLVPTITSLSPSSGPVGTSLTVTGTNFTATGNMVNFGNGAVINLPATGVATNSCAYGATCSTIWSLTFTVPANIVPACAYVAPYCPFAQMVTSPGIYNVSVANSNGTSNTYSFTVSSTTVASPLTITTSSLLPNETVGINYSTSLNATGGSGFYTWTVTSGTLPQGVTIGNAPCSFGTCARQPALVGAPTMVGNYTFSLSVTDGTYSTTSQFTMAVVPLTPTAIPTPTATPLSVCQHAAPPAGCVWQGIDMYPTCGATLVCNTPLPTPTLTPSIVNGGATVGTRLVRADGDAKVYYITDSGLKHWIPDIATFNSYGDSWTNVAVVSPTQLNMIPDSTLIRLSGDSKVYKIENGTKRWVTSPDAFNRNSLSWSQITSVNQTELNAYSSGADIN